MRLLFLGAHPDDIEIGCGATMHKYLRLLSTPEMYNESSYSDIKVVIFSRCADAVPKDWPEDSIVKECYESLTTLGLGHSEITIHDFPNKNLRSKRQEILDELYKMRANDWGKIFVCSSYNSHQDHKVVFEEALRAFRGQTLLGYLMPHSDYGSPEFPIYSKVQERDLDAKLDALSHYKSQYELKRPYFNSGYLKAIAMAHASEAGLEYAEKFQNIREIF